MDKNLPQETENGSQSAIETRMADFILRIKDSEAEPGNYEVVFAAETKSFFSRILNPIGRLIFENNVLKYVLANQWRVHKYNQEYICFLMGGYDQKKFLSIARAYAVPFREDISQEELAVTASVILDTLGETLTSGDLSHLLNVDPSNIENALSSYPFINKEAENEG